MLVNEEEGSIEFGLSCQAENLRLLTTHLTRSEAQCSDGLSVHCNLHHCAYNAVPSVQLAVGAEGEPGRLFGLD